jgi:hypothetical protein
MCLLIAHIRHASAQCSKLKQMHRRALRRADAFTQAHAADDDGSADAGGAETYAFLPQVLLGCVCNAPLPLNWLLAVSCQLPCPAHVLCTADCCR